jgi:hypothetical protein
LPSATIAGASTRPISAARGDNPSRTDRKSFTWRADTGTWSIRDDQLCVEWKKIEPRRLTLAAVVSGPKIEL